MRISYAIPSGLPYLFSLLIVVNSMNALNFDNMSLQETTFHKWLEDCMQSECETWLQQSESEWKCKAGRTRSFGELSEPSLTQVGAGRYEVTIPVHSGSMVFTTEKASSDEKLLLQFAKSIQREINSARNFSELQVENDEFAEQTISNFEQLAFLKHAARQLLLVETSYGVEAMAQDILPKLKGLIEATDIHLFIIDPDNPNRDPVFGGEVIDPFATRYLLNTYSSKAFDNPCVMNCCSETEEFVECPEVESFVIASVKHGSQLLGWIVAVNKLESDFRLHKYDDSTRVSEAEFGTVEADLLSSAGTMLATQFFNVDLIREKEALLTNIILALASALDAKDPYTCGHSERVAAFAKRIAAEMGVSDEKAEEIYLTGLLHDIGKIGIDDSTLTFPGPLSNDQYEQIKTHPDGGWSILHGITQLRYVLPGVLFHHERFDGAGYPDGLSGSEIPLEARILAVADAYDAMTSSRPYRNGMTHQKAVGILKDGAGTQWDPEVIENFLAIADEMIAIGESTGNSRSHDRRIKGTVSTAR